MEGKRPDLLYIASPYSHSEREVEEQRFKTTMDLCLLLLKRNFFVFSPIVHCHPLRMHDEHMARLLNRESAIEGHYAFWKAYNLRMLESCDSLVVLEINGWKESTGVTMEIQPATRWMKPIYFFNGETLTSLYERS